MQLTCSGADCVWEQRPAGVKSLSVSFYRPVSTDRLCLSFLSVRKIKKSGFIDLIYPSFRSRPLIHIGVASWSVSRFSHISHVYSCMNQTYSLIKFCASSTRFFSPGERWCINSFMSRARVFRPDVTVWGQVVAAGVSPSLAKRPSARRWTRHRCVVLV